MKYEYHKNQKADENFEQLVRAVFPGTEGSGFEETA
jgi:hypothetical protein